MAYSSYLCILAQEQRNKKKIQEVFLLPLSFNYLQEALWVEYCIFPRDILLNVEESLFL